jgi:hypothetical protein
VHFLKPINVIKTTATNDSKNRVLVKFSHDFSFFGKAPIGIQLTGPVV